MALIILPGDELAPQPNAFSYAASEPYNSRAKRATLNRLSVSPSVKPRHHSYEVVPRHGWDLGEAKLLEHDRLVPLLPTLLYLAPDETIDD